MLPNGTSIPSNFYISNGQRGIYIHACMLLHWLNELNVHKAKKYGFDSVETIYKSACKYIEIENLQLPKSVNNLRIKVRDFRKFGYEAVISGKLGNDNSKKIGKGEKAEFQEAYLEELLSQHNRFDYEQVARMYNEEAILKSFKAITARSVENFYNKHKIYIENNREGAGIAKMQNRRSKPSSSLFYVTADGWDVELPYQETKLVKTGKDKGKIKTTFHKRLMLYVVLDPFNNYPIGYSIGKSENKQLTKDAYQNMVQHVKSLTGEYYRPWQIQTDNFLSKKLKGFFEALCKYYTPAATGNAKSKVVERYFHSINKNYCQKEFNWSGFNLSSTNKNQPNTEVQNKYKKHYPTEQEVRDFVVKMIHAERSKKQVEWLQNFNALPADKKLTLSRENYLLLFGEEKTETNKILGSVLSPTINGKTIIYDTLDLKFRELIAQDWITLYDHSDLSTILVISKDEKHHFLLQQKYIQPMAIMDRSEGDIDTDELKVVKDFNISLEEAFDIREEERFKTITAVFDNENEPSDAATLIKQSFIINGQHKIILADQNSIAKANIKVIKLEQKEEKEKVKDAENTRLDYIKTKNLPNILNND